MSNFINVDNLYYAVMSKDDTTGATYGAMKAIPGSVKIAVDATTGRSPFYADGRVQEYGQVLGEIKVSLDVSTVPLSVLADLLGHTTDGMGGIAKNVGDQAPYVAFAYRRKKVNGKFRYVKLYKVIFEEPKDDAETSATSPKIQNDTFTGVAMPRIFDGQWNYSADADEAGYIDVASTWFAAIGTADIVAPVISSSVPTTGATAVSASTTYAWVFSKSLNPSTITTNNLYLIKDTDGTIVPASIAYNDATKTVTLTPSSALTAATKYLAVATSNVKDLAGNSLVTTARIFTTV